MFVGSLEGMKKMQTPFFRPTGGSAIWPKKWPKFAKFPLRRLLYPNVIRFRSNVRYKIVDPSEGIINMLSSTLSATRCPSYGRKV